MSLFWHNMLSEPSYGHFVILSPGHAFRQNRQNQKRDVSRLRKHEMQKKGHFAFSNFKSWALVFMFRCLVSEIWPFYEKACPGDKIRKWPYLGLESTKCKNKVTLLSRTLKVEEKKVPLVFCFVASFPRYGHFLKKHVQGTKSENGRIST